MNSHMNKLHKTSKSADILMNRCEISAANRMPTSSPVEEARAPLLMAADSVSPANWD